jgi:mitochondrial fission protein ELM1
MASTVSIWRFIDGKAGHRNQILGLTDAIGRRTAIECHDVVITDGLRGLKSLLPGRLRTLRDLPSPSILIGAGHATHVPLLAARHRFGGRAVVLMKPTLPLRMFDACLVSSADELRRVPSNIIVTEGALNRVRPSTTHDPRRGLILVGGPSDHFAWSDNRVLSQLAAIIHAAPEVSWTLTTSRRTPSSFLEHWSNAGLPGQMIPVNQTSPEWLPRQLQSAGAVWVTMESVSMICEARTSGAAVGVIRLENQRASRVTRGIESMINRELVTSFEKWSATGALHSSAVVLDEASRCADLLIERLLPNVELTLSRHPHAA